MIRGVTTYIFFHLAILLTQCHIFYIIFYTRSSIPWIYLSSMASTILTWEKTYMQQQHMARSFTSYHWQQKERWSTWDTTVGNLSWVWLVYTKKTRTMHSFLPSLDRARDEGLSTNSEIFMSHVFTYVGWSTCTHTKYWNFHWACVSRTFYYISFTS